MAPAQELDDWFEHWATQGVKPLFTCEYMVPVHLGLDDVSRLVQGRADLRQRRRCRGNSASPSGARSSWATGPTGSARRRRRTSAGRPSSSAAGRLWHRWDYPYQVGSPVLRRPARDHRHVPRRQLAGLPHLGRLGHLALGARLLLEPPPGRRQGPQATQGRLGGPAAPGFSPDYIDEQYERMDLAFERVRLDRRRPTGRRSCGTTGRCWPTSRGKPAAFTSKDHNFYPGETVEKQIIVINNSRETVTADCRWSLALPQRPCRRRHAA